MDKSIERYVRILVKLLNLTGMTNAEIATGAGLSDGTIGQIARGVASPVSLSTVRRIEKFAAEVIGEKL